MTEVLDMSAAEHRRALALVYQSTGVTMLEAKQSMLQGRLRARMRALNVSGYAAYLDRVDADPAERRCFIDVVTTHQTQFFRTPRIWQHLSTVFLPEWMAANPGGTLQVWSAAASTGEECCSLAMACEEARLGQQGAAPGPGFDYRIFASDISPGVLSRAEAMCFDGDAVKHLREKWPQQHTRFNASRDAGCFEPLPALKQRMRFAVANLMEPAPRVPSGYDLVLLRNVLIYFTQDDCIGVVRRVGQAMKPGALLVVGESESLNGWDVPFEFVQPQIYRRLA